MRVLLIDDSALLQQTVGDALRRSGSAVDVSCDGEDALRQADGSKRNRLTFSDLEIDTAARKVWRAGQPVKLKPREYQLLEYLAHRSGEVVSQSEIEVHLCDNDAELMNNVVKSALSSLRRKLGQANPAPLIQTRRGCGYILEAKAS